MISAHTLGYSSSSRQRTARSVGLPSSSMICVIRSDGRTLADADASDMLRAEATYVGVTSLGIVPLKRFRSAHQLLVDMIGYDLRFSFSSAIDLLGFLVGS